MLKESNQLLAVVENKLCGHRQTGTPTPILNLSITRNQRPIGININLRGIDGFCLEAGLLEKTPVSFFSKQDKKKTTKKSQIQTPAPISDNIIDFCDIKIHQVPSSPSQYCSAKASLSATLNAELS